MLDDESPHVARASIDESFQEKKLIIKSGYIENYLNLKQWKSKCSVDNVLAIASFNLNVCVVWDFNAVTDGFNSLTFLKYWQIYNDLCFEHYFTLLLIHENQQQHFHIQILIQSVW